MDELPPWYQKMLRDGWAAQEKQIKDKTALWERQLQEPG